jgi:hypothetical protein
MSLDRLIESWKEVRAGFIEEVGQIPPDQFSFKATPETRSIAALVQHVVEVQKVLTGESCRSDTNLMRQSFADHIKEYAADVGSVNDKNGLLELMRSSMEMAEATIRTCGDGLKESMQRFDGKELSKLDMLNFAVSGSSLCINACCASNLF